MYAGKELTKTLNKKDGTALEDRGERPAARVHLPPAPAAPSPPP